MRKWNPGGVGDGGRSFVREEEADVAKSLGAAKVGEEIRNSPHRAEVERFLDTELRGTERQAKGMPQILDEANDWARDSGLVFHTYGEMLVAARLAKMWDNSAYQAPLQTGHLHGAELDAYLKEFPITNSHTHSFNRLDGYKLQSFIQNNFVDEARSGEITVKEAIRLMKTDPVFREYVPNSIDEFASAAQHQWARSVSTNPSSLALMSTVARMRGHEFVETAPSKPDAHMADRGFDEPGKFDPATGVTVYPPINRTWSPVVPKSMGEYITYGLEKEIAYELDRGVPYEALAYGIHAASARHLADQGLNPEDTIHIYRGVRDYSDSSKNRDMGEPWERTPEQVNVTTNPLSSWSTNKIEARAFGNRMMAYDVKVKDIFATSATGFGSLSEQEIVPFGGPTDVTQVLLRSSQMGEHVPFSVERPLEFINHNHTPTSAHPNAGGVLRDYKDKRMLQADEIKSIGAARGGAAIRNSPEHNKAVQEFLAQPFKDPIPEFTNKLGPTHAEIASVDPLTKLWRVPFNPTTVGEALIARRIQEILGGNSDLSAHPNFLAKKLMPLDSGDIHPNEVEAHMRAKRYTTVGEFRDVVRNAVDINGNTSVPMILKSLRSSGMEPFIPRAEDEFVARGQDHWANSVTGNPASIALMSRVAVSHLGMKLFTPNDVHGREYGTQEGHARGYEEFLKRAPVYDALAYGIHQASVAHFESLGFKPDDTIRIYRGMGLSPSHPIAQVIANHPYEEPPAWYKGPPPAKLTAHTVEATMNPLSSWSTDQMTAREQFGDHVLRTDIKVKDIFATAATGFGAANEFEVIPYGRGTDTYWASRSALPTSMLKLSGTQSEMDAHNYPDIIMNQGSSTQEIFNVQRPLEFVNHNHTPGRGHPNAPGASSTEKEAWATVAQAEKAARPKTKWIDTSRGSRLNAHWEEKKTFMPQEIKSMGASAVGEAIRHSPKHNMAVQEFLNRPASGQTSTGLVTKYMQDIGAKFGLGTGLKGETVGDMLVIRRLDAMISFGPNRVMPLDHGHFGASDEAVSYFRNPPKMQGGNVSGATIAFHIHYPKEATTVQEAVANLRRAGLADYIPQPEHELAARMQEAWASSATTNVASVALMHATAKQRGLSPRIERAAQEAPTADDDEEAISKGVIYERVNMDQVRADAQREYESAPAMYDALAYGIHKASSDHIARLGLTPNDKITVYRGMDPTGAGETISRGWMESGKTTDVSATMNPISSWSTDRETTRIFGEVVFKWEVPVRDIFATSATGFGSAGEWEVVTYGGRVHRMEVHAIMGDFPAYGFSVERPLEFVNHNHTPTSAHPNAPAWGAPTGEKRTLPGGRVVPVLHLGPLYHGTTRQAAQEIMKHGFATDDYGQVSLTPDREYAYEYAKMRIKHDATQLPVILRVNVVGVDGKEVGYSRPSFAREAGADFLDQTFGGSKMTGHVYVLNPATAIRDIRIDPEHNELSVERALEFINRNHTPGRGHPNPGFRGGNTSLYPKDTQHVTRKSDSRPLAQGATNVKSVRGHKGMYGTDAERRIPHQGETVDIYRDLGHGREFKRGFPDDMAFSMRHPSSLPGERTNLVVASTVGVRLANPRPSWATAAKVQAEREGKRGVHAFIRGDVQEYLTPAQASKIVSDPAWQKVTYYPGTQDFFIPSTRHRVIGGEEAVLSNGQFYVRNPKIVKKPVPVSQIEKRIAEKASVTASVERRLFEEFVNRNHTKTSAHPNMNGAFLAGKREEANSPKILKGANDFYTLSSEEFKSNLRMRRLGFAGTDPVRKQVVEFISKWTGAENKISDIRAIPEEWAPAIAWMKEHAVKNDVPLYRSVQLNKDINEMVLVGERIPNRLASSFTESESYMSGFRNTRIVAEPGTVHGISVAWLSNTPHEKEWILLNDFEAVAVRKADDGGGYDTHMLVTVKETHEPLKKWSL